MDDASAALTRIDTHEKICAERYGNLWAKLVSMETQFTVIHVRFNTISNRMWAGLAAVCGASVVGLAVTVFYLLTRGH